jgi:hypothetical protein
MRFAKIHAFIYPGAHQFWETHFHSLLRSSALASSLFCKAPTTSQGQLSTFWDRLYANVLLYSYATSLLHIDRNASRSRYRAVQGPRVSLLSQYTGLDELIDGQDDHTRGVGHSCGVWTAWSSTARGAHQAPQRMPANSSSILSSRGGFDG